MLKLSKRICKFGKSINTRTEMHGDEPTPALDIPLKEIMLLRVELDTLLGESLASEALFLDSTGGVDPLFHMFEPFKLKHKFEDCTVRFEIGLAPYVVELKGVKLAGVTLEPLKGGVTELSLKVQCHPTFEGQDIEMLIGQLDRTCSVSIEFGEAVKADDDQPELPLTVEPTTPAELFEKPKRKRKTATGDSLQ